LASIIYIRPKILLAAQLSGIDNIKKRPIGDAEMRLSKYISFIMAGFIILFSLTISIQTAEPNKNTAALKSTNRPWNVKEDVLPARADDRDRYLQEADAKIRKGLLKLSEKYKQLSKARDWNNIISGKSNIGQINIFLFHKDTGKAQTSQKSIPKNEQYHVLVVIQTPPEELPQMAMSNLYPNLGLVGQVGASAGDAKLEADLKKLIDESLKPVEKLELILKKANEYYEKNPMPISVELSFVDKTNEFQTGRKIIIEAKLKNDTNQTQIYPRGFGMTSAKWSCQIELISPDGKAWAAEAMPFLEYHNYNNIKIEPNQTLRIGQWDLSSLEYNEGHIDRGGGTPFSKISDSGQFSIRWWDGVFQGGQMISSPLKFDIISKIRNSSFAQEDNQTKVKEEVRTTDKKDENFLTYTDEKRHFRFQYPKDWKIAIGPRLIGLHFEAFVALNNAGKENFWVEPQWTRPGIRELNPKVVADLLPEGCVYFRVGWVEGPPTFWSPAIVEMESDNLSELLVKASEIPAGDKRLTNRGLEFYKWGKWWSIGVTFRQPVNPKDRDKANKILESFRFIGIPSGDEAWAINEAHKQLPIEIRPDLSFNRTGGNEYRSTRAAKDGNDFIVTFTKADPNNKESKRIWQFKVTSTGEVIRISSPDSETPKKEEK
jgi:hypothetical protein